MAQLTRRSLLVGLASASVISSKVALAQQQELIQRGPPKTFPSEIPGTSEIRVRDAMYHPGARTSNPMPHTMICECTVGVLVVSQDSKTTTMNTGDMWTCHEGMVETVENKGTMPAVMRVIQLVPA